MNILQLIEVLRCYPTNTPVMTYRPESILKILYPQDVWMEPLHENRDGLHVGAHILALSSDPCPVEFLKRPIMQPHLPPSFGPYR